jgi:hypothetical protein
VTAAATKTRPGDPAAAGRIADTAPPLNLPNRRSNGGGGGGGGGAAGRGAGRPSTGTSRPASGARPLSRTGGGGGKSAPKPTSWGDRPERKPAPAPKPAPRPAAKPGSGGVTGSSVPRQRETPASAGRDQAPPLWAKRVADTEPPTPFWLRPADSSDSSDD